jgi:hypothetical protein
VASVNLDNAIVPNQRINRDKPPQTKSRPATEVPNSFPGSVPQTAAPRRPIFVRLLSGEACLLFERADKVPRFLLAGNRLPIPLRSA